MKPLARLLLLGALLGAAASSFAETTGLWWQRGGLPQRVLAPSTLFSASASPSGATFGATASESIQGNFVPPAARCKSARTKTARGGLSMAMPPAST
jgi:hypothetical protein